MNKSILKIMTILLPAGLLLLVMGMYMIQPIKKYSDSERRALMQRPQLLKSKLSTGAYAKEYEAFLVDQFPGRDFMRSVKSKVKKKVFMQKDNNGYYCAKGHLSRMEYPLNENKLAQKIKQHQEIVDLLPENFDGALYFSLIPDKNLFLAKENGYLSMDYDEYATKLKQALKDTAYIDIYDELALDSYYRTDPHWRQEQLEPVARKIAKELGVTLNAEYLTKEVKTPFYGAYYQQSKIKGKPDTIFYLTNQTLENCEVTSFDTGEGKKTEIYPLEKETGKDLYEIFLGGADALITIENKECNNTKELVVFRDSFGSSLAPLLVAGYQKITLVDMRYMNVQMLDSCLQWNHQDILFLYSTL